MAAVIPPPSSTIAAISPFFHSSYPFLFPLRLNQPPSLSLAPPSSTFKPNLRHEFHSHFSASTHQSILSPESNPHKPRNLKPISHLDCSSSDSASDSPVDVHHLLHLLRLSQRYADVELARAVHASILKLGDDTFLSNAVIIAYLKLGALLDAYKVFEDLSCPDVVSYTALISSFAKVSRENEASRLFFEMRSEGIDPNEYSFVAILTACVRILDLELGLQVHALAIKSGFVESVFAANALMSLYGKSGCLNYAVQVFNEMPQRDITTWNTVISSMVNEQLYDKALDLFRDLCCSTCLKADQFTLSSALTACAGCCNDVGGREVHGHAIKIGLESNLSINNAALGFYTKCGILKDAETLFESMPVRDVISWTQMITAFMEFGLVDKAMELFEQMPEKNSVSFNAVLAGFCKNGEGSKALQFFLKMVHEEAELTDFTLTSIINACGILMDYKISRQIHGFIMKFGFGSNACIEAALLEMYTRCGRMKDANRMFQKWPSDQDSSIVRTSLFCGYARNGMPEKAISHFYQSQSEGTIIIDEVVLTSVLGVCGTLGFHEMGEQIHCHALKTGYAAEIGVGNSLVSMYSKCCNIDSAVKSFNSMQTRDIVSWNCLISGHVLHRQGDKALALWSTMEKSGLRPDTVTCVLIISAHKHTTSNSVDNCRNFFLSMKKYYGVDPNAEHYASLVGVLGHWGLLEEAEETILNMPCVPEVSVWRSLLDSCRIHSNTSIGKRVAKRILDMDPQDASTYALMSNLYSASGRWHCSDMVRDEMRERGIRKYPCRSWIVHQKEVHSFYVRDRSHPQAKDIYGGLDVLILECLKAGYEPDTSYVLHELEEHQKKEFLFYHSAKLAVTYGLLVTKSGEPVRVVKNVNLCGDCHTFLKHVSAVTGREIVLRDASGFHCFSNGKCTCRDYW